MEKYNKYVGKVKYYSVHKKTAQKFRKMQVFTLS